jgi:tripeptide aminopeptidase
MIINIKSTATALFVLMLTGIASTVTAQESEKTAVVTIDKKYTAEIKKIAAAPLVKKAMQQIVDLEKETMSNHVLLTEIPSPPYKEAKRAAKFAEMIKAAGIDSVWTDTAGNVLAFRKGRTGKKRVVLEAHMDTVFPEGTDVTVKYRGDTLCAPGVGDDTRSLSVLLTIIKVMKETDIQTDADVIFVGATGEEGQGDLRGVKNLFSPAGPGKIDSFIAIDGSGNEGIVHRALGSHRYRVTFKGPGGHSSGAFGIGNPHNALGRAMHYWDESGNAYAATPGTRVTFSVGVIGGGTSVNSIPFESWMEVDMRSENPERLNAMDALLKAAISKALAEENAIKKMGQDLSVDIRLIGDRPAGNNPATIPLVQRMMATISYLGGTPKLGVGSTDSNIPFAKGVPAMTIGQGGKAGNAHSLNEWFLNDKGYIGIQQSLLVLLSEAGLAK